jgi:hypothetical protein
MVGLLFARHNQVARRFLSLPEKLSAEGFLYRMASGHIANKKASH